MNSTNNYPKGITALRKFWKQDLMAGFVVSLIAMPLSIGIAIASGLPPSAGLIAAIAGGMVVSLFSGCHVTINGPAAGLIVIVLNATEKLGEGDTSVGYPYFLAAVIFAGVLLVLAGFLKAGKLGDFFPLSVVHGMLAAIGIIIMSKQIHFVLGASPLGKTTLELVSEIPQSVEHWNPYVAFIGFLSIFILAFFQIFKFSFLKFLPPPLIVVVVGILLGNYLKVGEEGFYSFGDLDHVLGAHYLVALPEDFLFFPDFSKSLTFDFWSVVLTVAVIQGVESLLSATAVEQLDPLKRQSDLNKDLKAVGAGSMVGGALGGIPIIAEIVRSSANVSNGAVTPWANFFHGGFILLGTLLIPSIINQIPLTALAGILVMVGFRLASPKEFVHTYEIGKEQVLIFIVTIVAVLATDLLLGIGTGIVVKIVSNFILGAKIKHILRPAWIVEKQGGKQILVRLSGSYTFTNLILFKQKLIAAGIENDKITLDFSEVSFIDHTSYEKLIAWQRNCQDAGKICYFIGMAHLKALSRYPTSARSARFGIKVSYFEPEINAEPAVVQEEKKIESPAFSIPQNQTAEQETEHTEEEIVEKEENSGRK
jgi:MFS superfamily sulfate permease-like transporter